MATKRRKSSVSPSARSLKELRKQGYIAESVEKRIRNWITKDFINVIDILAFKTNGEIGDVVGVQATSTDHVSHRINKALAEPRLVGWLKAGCRFEVWGWAKRGARGERKLYTLTRRELTLADFSADTIRSFAEISGTLNTDEGGDDTLNRDENLRV